MRHAGLGVVSSAAGDRGSVRIVVITDAKVKRRSRDPFGTVCGVACGLGKMLANFATRI
jgi:hypothetical protein